jgi:hypothetical protein
MTREGDEFIFEKPERSGNAVVDLGMIAMAKFGKMLKFCQNESRSPACVPTMEDSLPSLIAQPMID